MAKKRFTDIEIWDKEWYMELKPRYKCLMKYIFDKCDAAGCWKPNWKLASLHIGEDVNFADLDKLPHEQYEVLPSGKIFIPDFINFQYGRLSKECKPHIQIIILLEKNEVLDRFTDFIDESGKSVKALRKRLTENAKKEIYESDDYQCQYCGVRPGIEMLFVDHILALVKGGNNSPDNLTTSCKSCNQKKHDDDVFEFMKKHNIKPLDNLNKKLDRVYKKRVTLQEEEEEKEEDSLIFKKEQKTELNKSVIIPEKGSLKNSNLFRQPNIPKYEAVLEVFLRGGGTEEMAKNFFNKHGGVGWFLNGSPITNFSNLVPSYIQNWQKNERAKSTPAAGGRNAGAIELLEDIKRNAGR